MIFKNIWTITIVIVLLLVAMKLSNLYTDLNKPENKGSPLATKLFNNLKKNNLIKISDDSQVILPEQDVVIIELESGANKNDEEIKTKKKLIESLYYHPSGGQVRKQVELWNYTRHFAAIRDNRNKKKLDVKNRWKISDINDLAVRSFSYVPLDFAYITNGKSEAGFNNWRGAGNKNHQLKFFTKFKLPSKQEIKIQVIGNISKSAINKLKISPKYKFISIKERKPVEKKCNTENNTLASAYEIVLNLPKGETEISLIVNTTGNNSKESIGLALAILDKQKISEMKKNNKCGFVANDFIEVDEFEKENRCKTKDDYQLVWNNCLIRTGSPSSSTATHRAFQIFTDDNIALTKAYSEKNKSNIGKPTGFSKKNGLLSLLGQDKNDIFSLSGLLWKSNLAEDTKISLTLNSKLQEITQTQLIKALKKQKYSTARRAAVVLLSPQTGEILAAANYPNPKAGVHLWDRKAISYLYPQNDPYRFNPWQGMAGDNAPGSTFKVVTALAALKASETDTKLETILEGVKPSYFRSTTGLTLNSNTYQPPGDPEYTSLIHNHGSRAVGDAANRPLYRKSCRKSNKVSGVIGLREATRDSINNWYANLGVKMDKTNLNNQETVHLLDMANILGFIQPKPIKKSVNDSEKNTYSKLSYIQKIDVFQKDNMKLHQYPAINSSRGDILNLFNGKMDLIIEDKNLDISINRLAQNSIGQAMTTTPLQMAKVAASIATGKIIDPQLLKSKNGTNYLLNKKENLDVPHLQWLRDGMKSVVEKGTAAFAFKDKLACQVYGKTGTAQVGQRDKEGKWNNKRNSAWFIGWYQPEKKQPKFAFACMVTHANGSGGKVCAPIIRNILKEWNKKNLPPLKLGGKK